MSVAQARPGDKITVSADGTLSGRARAVPFAREAKHLAVLAGSFVALLGGYVCAKLAEADEMRYTLTAVIFRVLAVAGGNAAGYMPPTPVWALALLLTVSTGAMLAGGAIRAAAAAAMRRSMSNEQATGAQTHTTGDTV